MNKNPFIIISKPIAGGGSTFLDMLKKTIPEIIVIQEPVSNFKLLKAFVNDPKRYAFPFQLETFERRSQALYDNKGSIGKRIVVMERSIYDDKYIFARYHHDIGNITDEEWDCYCSLFSQNLERNFIKPDYYIYLRVSPEVAWERKQKRDREEEKAYCPQYFIDLHQYFEEFQIYAGDVATKGFIMIDGDKDFENIPSVWRGILWELRDILPTFETIAQEA